MREHFFPTFTAANWSATRDTMADYARVLGKIRRTLTPTQKHWWHVSLQPIPYGLTTTTLPVGAHASFELRLNYINGEVSLHSSEGDDEILLLEELSAQDMAQEILLLLDQMLGMELELDLEQFSAETPTYDWEAAEEIWLAFAQTDLILQEFKAGLRQETSPVQLWPHHFDLAMLWLSGCLVPDQDPNDPEYADEQMNFGFLTGDEMVPEPYFYITAYPWPEGLEQVELPAGATWHVNEWRGAILTYADLLKADDPRGELLHFLQSGQRAGQVRMLID